MQTQIETLRIKLYDLGFRPQPWKNKRIYLNHYEDVVIAYIELENAINLNFKNLWEGCTLRVFGKGQYRLVQISKAKQVKHEISVKLFEADIITVKPCKNWEDIIL